MKKHQPAATLVAGCALLVAFVGGCLPFALGDPSKSKVDSKLVGYWLNDGSDDRDLIAMYPFDEHTYVLQDQKLHQDDGKWTPRDPPQLYKAWLTEIKGHRLLCMEPLFQKVVRQDQNIYPAMLIEQAGADFKARLVNSDFEPLKSVKNATDELAIVTREINNQQLYGDPTTFHRLDPERDKDAIAPVAKF